MIINFLMFVSVTFAQTEIMEDGKKEILSEDKIIKKASLKAPCVIEGDFKEKKWSSTKIRTRNKTTILDLKRFVSKDTGVPSDKIFLLSYTDTAANGKYILCVDGFKSEYKRNGSVFKKI